MRSLIVALALLVAAPAVAQVTQGVTVYNGNTRLGLVGKLKFSSGICAKTAAGTVTCTVSSADLGNFTFSGNTETLSQAMNIGTALTSSLSLSNTTAAADGAQQYSPAVTMCGNGWATNGGGSSMGSCWSVQSRPAQFATPLATLTFTETTNGTPSDALSIYTIYGTTRIRAAGAGPLELYDQGQAESIKIQAGSITSEAASINFSGNALPGNDAARTLGGASKRWSYVAASDVVGDLPACDATTRGAMTVVQSGAGVGDILKVCMKGTADTYAYRDAFTAP